MKETLAQLKHVGHEKRVYNLQFRPDSPWSEIYEALTAMRSFAVEQLRIEDLVEKKKQEEKMKGPK